MENDILGIKATFHAFGRAVTRAVLYA